MKHSKLINLGLTALLASSAHGAIVYQDNFDNDTLATNTSTGGGIELAIRQGSTADFIDDGDLSSVTNAHNERANAYSINAFDLTGGFTLTTVYSLDTGTTTSGSADRFHFGLIESGQFDTGAQYGGYQGNFLITGTAVGIGISAHDASGTGLYQTGDSQSTGQTLPTSPASNVTAAFTVNADSTYSYSINGATASTGTLSTAFDFSKTYQFATYFQDTEVHGQINSVTLDVIPEPSSAALLGLSGLALLRRRRK